MKLLTALTLMGSVDSIEQQIATAELAVKEGCEPISVAIPLEQFPCEIKEGETFKIVMLTKDSEPVIVCSKKGE